MKNYCNRQLASPGEALSNLSIGWCCVDRVCWQLNSDKWVLSLGQQAYPMLRAFNLTIRSVSDRLDTNSPRRVLKSSPRARHSYVSDTVHSTRFDGGVRAKARHQKRS